MSGKMSSKVKFTPLRSCDINMVKMLLGMGNHDLRYLLGGSAQTISQGKNKERQLHPSMAILVRLLWNNPEDNPLPDQIDFDSVRERFGSVYAEWMNKNPDKMMPQTIAAIMTGNRREGGTRWLNTNAHPAQPSPQTQRLFWVLMVWADKHGEKEAFRRWVRAVEQEADARDTTIEDLFRSGVWPKIESPPTEDEGDDADGSENDSSY